MGPKKDGENKKTEKKKQDKVIDDRTFGLKNKNKSKTVQKFIKGVEQVVRNDKTVDAKLQLQFAEKAEKRKQKEEEAFMNSLYKSVKVVKQTELDDGEESKNVICAFFKAGMCEKGDDCEFSHDLNIQFNQGAFDIYTDLRDVKNKDNEINRIAEEKEKKRSKVPQSSIICKFFLDAVQRKVYGWKWECPNGDECHYKHCLPKGFVITTQKDKMQEEMSIEDYMNMEENIDGERERISRSGTPVNDTTFAEWKKKRDEFRQQSKDHQIKNRKIQTGIQLFRNQSNLFKDDENAADDLEREENQIDEEQNTANSESKRTEAEIMEDLEKDMQGIKVNAELFQDEDLEGLDDINDDEEEEEEEKHDI